MNRERLEYFLELSAVSYSELMPVKNNEQIYKINDPATDVQAYIIKDKDTAVIVFRGTDSCRDWASNLAIAHKSIPYNNANTKIRVHSGFLNSYASENVRGVIHKLINCEIRHIITAGHSYGAALAQLCAVDMQYNFPECDIESYQFGCPRIGNAAYARSYNRRIFKSFRIVNGNDIVAKLPPSFFGFRHTGIKIHTGNRNVPFYYSLTDHGTRAYYEQIIKSDI